MFWFEAMTDALPSQTEFHILLALAGGERHGYGIMQEVERRSGGGVKLGPGTLYGAVKRMLQSGWIEERAADAAEGDDPRRRCYYRLTPTGADVAAGMARHLADLVYLAADRGLVSLKPSS